MNDKAKIAELRAALNEAFNYGQTYWQQADSDSIIQNKRSDETSRKFDAFIDETCAALTADDAEQAPEAKVIAKVVSAYGDPEEFGERELIAIADLSTIPYGTKLYATAPAPIAAEPAPKLTECRHCGFMVALNQAPATPTETSDSAADVCEWHLADEDNGIWQSSCGEAWSFMDGGPKENRVSFCHHCGKPARIAAMQAKESK